MNRILGIKFIVLQLLNVINLRKVYNIESWKNQAEKIGKKRMAQFLSYIYI